MSLLVPLASLGPGVIQDADGNAQANRQINVFQPDTSAQVTVYTDATGASSLAQPLTTDSAGGLPGFVQPGQMVDLSDVALGRRIRVPVPSDPGVVVAAASTDSLGRTQILGTSTIPTPSLRNIISVTDAPWSAVGDGVVDDTAAAQAAINAVSAAGGGTVVLPAGYTFLLGTITPKNNVTVWAYGATLKLKPSSTFGMFFMNSGSVSNFYLRGGTYPGTGAETTNQTILQINTPATGADVGVFDTLVTNWLTGPFYFGNCVRVRACFNTIRHCCNFAGTNAINLLIGQSSGSVDFNTCLAIGNIIEDCQAEGISLGETGNTTVAPVKAIVANNIVNCASGPGGAGNTCINIEWSTTTTGEASEFVIVGNHCTLNATSTGASGIAATVSPAANNDPLVLSKVVIQGNTILSNQAGIRCNASDAVINGNHIEQTGTQGFGLLIQGNGTFTGTGDFTNASPTVNNVSAALNSVPNGAPIVVTGLPAGAFLLSGAGTTTWTLSTNFTGTTATGLSITARSQIKRVNATNNTIHAAASPTNPLVYLYALRDSIVSGNLIVCEAGSTTTQEGIFTQYCGWVDIVDNKIIRAPGSGIHWNISNDLTIARNRILNCSEGAASGFNGVAINNTSGTLYRIEGNIIVDDRTTHKMDTGVTIGSGVPTGVGGVELVGNEIRGARVGPTTAASSFALIKDNVTDSNTWPAATSAPAVPASGSPTTALPYPAMYGIAGGTLTHISYQRAGSSSRDVATTGPAVIFVAPNDTITPTYSVAPTTWTLIPMQI